MKTLSLFTIRQTGSAADQSRRSERTDCQECVSICHEHIAPSAINSKQYEVRTFANYNRTVFLRLLAANAWSKERRRFKSNFDRVTIAQENALFRIKLSQVKKCHLTSIIDDRAGIRRWQYESISRKQMRVIWRAAKKSGRKKILHKVALLKICRG